MIKNIWNLFKEWLIGKLGGIPMDYLSVEELQKIHNRIINERLETLIVPRGIYYGCSIFEDRSMKESDGVKVYNGHPDFSKIKIKEVDDVYYFLNKKNGNKSNTKKPSKA